MDSSQRAPQQAEPSYQSPKTVWHTASRHRCLERYRRDLVEPSSLPGRFDESLALTRRGIGGTDEDTEMGCRRRWIDLCSLLGGDSVVSVPRVPGESR